MVTAATIHTIPKHLRDELERELGIMSHVEGVKYRLARPEEPGWTMRIDNTTYWITDDGTILGSTVFVHTFNQDDADEDTSPADWD